MAYGKKAKSDLGTVVLWILALVVLAYIFVPGFSDKISGIFGPSEGVVVEPDTGVVNTKDCPSDLTTTYTINIQNALTSTATNVDSEYFIFNGNKLVKEGATGSDGTVDVDLSCGKDYSLLLVNTSVESGHYSKVLPLQARIPEDTVNAQVYRFGNVKILSIVNPADPSRRSNASFTANGVKNFELSISSNLSERAVNKPTIMCEVPTSNMSELTIDSFSDGTKVIEITALPKRISASSGQQYYAFQYDGLLSPQSGVISSSGTLTAGSNGVGDVSTGDMTCKVIDVGPYKDPDYKIATSIEEAFPEAFEDSAQADVGAPDSATKSFNFVNEAGY